MCASQLVRQRSVTFAPDTALAPEAINGGGGDDSLPRHSSLWKNYWLALRPWSFTASLTPVLLGTALAARSTDAGVNWAILATSCLTALAVHAAGNLVNTYFDYASGVDSAARWCDDRTLVDKLLTPLDVERFATGLYVVGTAAFVSTVIGCGGRSAFLLTLIFVLGMCGSFFYTGGGRSALKYKALGELLVFAVFGPITVAFAFFAQRAAVAAAVEEEEEAAAAWFLVGLPLRYALPLALNTVAILHANNLRDADNERSLGVTTIAIRIGPLLSRLLLAALLLLPFAMCAVIALHASVAFLLPLLALPHALALLRVIASAQTGADPAFRPVTYSIARLNLVLGALYVGAVMLAPVELFRVA